MSGRRNPRTSKPDRKRSKAGFVPIRIQRQRETGILWAIVIVLLAFGIFKAVVLWGAYPIPNPDFPGFIATGKSLLSFQCPESFKRAPVVGILQVLLSRLLPVDNPELTAGWLLNAILSVFNGILLFWIGRRWLGNLAALIAIVAMLNPWVLIAQVDPIAETTMLFFIFLSFGLMMVRSSWAYLAASVASLVRYECAALIAICFALDLLNNANRRQQWQSIGRLAAASMPFLLWMLGTWIHWNPTASHYLKHYGHGDCIREYFEYLGQSAFGSLVQWPPTATAAFAPQRITPSTTILQSAGPIVVVVVLAVACLGLTASVAAAFLRRNSGVWALWAFILLYLPVHIFRAETHYRYSIPIAGLLLLLCCVGWKAILQELGRICWPGWLPIALKIGIASIAMIWLVLLLGNLPTITKLYLKGRWLPWAGISAITAVAVLEWIRRGWPDTLRNLTLSIIAAVAVVSVQFPAVSFIGNGSRIEFKKLADWYLDNTTPGQRLADRYAGTLRLLAPSRSEDFVNMSRELKSQTLEEFVRKCYKLNVRYVAWSPRGSAGSKQGLEVVGKILSQPRDCGPLRFVHRIEVGPGRWINIFCLPGPGEMNPSPPGL